LVVLNIWRSLENTYTQLEAMDRELQENGKALNEFFTQLKEWIIIYIKDNINIKIKNIIIIISKNYFKIILSLSFPRISQNLQGRGCRPKFENFVLDFIFGLLFDDLSWLLHWTTLSNRSVSKVPMKWQCKLRCRKPSCRKPKCRTFNVENQKVKFKFVHITKCRADILLNL
jgi:hypothetical protein